MRSGPVSLLFLAFTLAGCISHPGSPARPVALDKNAADKIVKEIEKERADDQDWLRGSPTSYLAAIDRVNFGEKKTLSVGSAPENDVRLLAPDIEPHHLRITLDGDHFRVVGLDANARFKIKDETRREAMLDPSFLGVGRFMLRLSHQRFPAIIVFDPRSPHFNEYKGLAYFPIDLSYRYELPLERYPKPRKITIGSTRGNARAAEVVGRVEFMVGRTPCRLEATRLTEPGAGEDPLEIFFCDASGGKETYPLGRYVDLKKLDNGNYLLDFNLAYNPACAFSDFYNCPIPPKSNTLRVEIRAGEKDAHYHHSPDSQTTPIR
jgi:hypothetical protein